MGGGYSTLHPTYKNKIRSAVRDTYVESFSEATNSVWYEKTLCSYLEKDFSPYRCSRFKMCGNYTPDIVVEGLAVIEVRDSTKTPKSLNQTKNIIEKYVEDAKLPGVVVNFPSEGQPPTLFWYYPDSYGSCQTDGDEEKIQCSLTSSVNVDTTDSASMVQIEIPKFHEDISTWLVQLSLFFESQKITCSRKKFCLTAATLPGYVAAEVFDLLTNPPAKDPFHELYKALMKMQKTSKKYRGQNSKSFPDQSRNTNNLHDPN